MTILIVTFISSGTFILIISLLFGNYKRNEYLFTKSIFSPKDILNTVDIKLSKKKINVSKVGFCILLVAALVMFVLIFLTKIIYIRIILSILVFFYIYSAASIFLSPTFKVGRKNFKLPLINYSDNEFYIIAKLNDTTYIIQECKNYKSNGHVFELIDIKDIKKFKLVSPE